LLNDSKEFVKRTHRYSRHALSWLVVSSLIFIGFGLSPLTKNSKARAATTVYQHDNITWPNALPGDVSISQSIQVDNPQALHFWASYFDVTADAGNPLADPITGGYFGLQTYGLTPTGTFKRSAIFSIWGGTAVSPSSTSCAQWPADPANPTPAELAEGSYGMQCAIEFPWVSGQPVSFTVARNGTGTGPNGFVNPGNVNGTYWLATATQGSTVTTIGRIFVPGTVHKLRPDYNFSEQFNAMPQICDQPGFTTRAKFFQPVTVANSPGGPVTTSAGTPGPQTIVNPCTTRQIVDSTLNYVVVEQGPNPTGPWAPTGDLESVFTGAGTTYLSGWADLPDTSTPIEMRVTINGVVYAWATGPRYFFTNALPANDVRRYQIAIGGIYPATSVLCVEAKNGSVWGSIGCKSGAVDTISGTFNEMVNDGPGTGGRARGVVNISGFAGGVGMRVDVNGVAGPTSYSEPGSGDRVFDIPFAEAPPGAAICAYANNAGVWVLISNCLSTPDVVLTSVSSSVATGTVSVPTFAGAITMRGTVDGVVQSTPYSSAGAGPRPFSVPVTANSGQSVCVEANAYGYWSRAKCDEVVNGESFVGATQPVRILDTRQSTVLTVGTTRNQTVAGAYGVPANATAVALNIAAVAPRGAGHLRVFPAGTALPNASVLNFAAGKNTPNHIVVKVGANGQISMYAGNTTDVIIDLAGYFVNDTFQEQYKSVPTPTRIITQTIPGAVVGNPAASTVNLSVLGAGGIPAVVGGVAPGVVAVNIGALNPAGTGHLRVYPTGAPLPTASTHNFVTGDSRTNLVLVRPSASGQISIYNASSGPVTITADTVGYFAQSGFGLKPVDPIRPLDTRLGGAAPLAPGAFIEVPIRGFGVVPNSANVKSVVVNVAAVNPSASGSIDVGPSGTNAPLPSFTHPANENVANLVMVPVGADGKIRLVNNSTGTSHVIVDITGYFTS
jgi:hypothetical protein